MTTFVVGASSQIGYFLLNRLRHAGRPALALSRQQRVAADDSVQWLQGSLDTLAPMQGLDAIVSFGPLLGLGQWLQLHDQAPAPALVATSSMSILSKAGSAQPHERAVVDQLVRGEALVRAQCQRLGMRWTILRPTLIYGAGRDRSLTPIARRAVRSRLFPLPGGGGLRQPVHADDLAALVLRALADGRADGRILEAGGGERLTAGQMFWRVRQALPVATLPLPVPDALMQLAGRLVPAVRGPVSRLQSDLVADNTAAQSLLGYAPRAFCLQSWMLGVGAGWQQRLQQQADGEI